jgi:glycine C-acetyltransferase
VQRLRDNAAWFRAALRSAGYRPLESESAIVPIIVGDTALAIRLSRELYDAHGVFVIGFGYPVVPEGAARLRVQLSATHSHAHLQRAADAFATLRQHGGHP